MGRKSPFSGELDSQGPFSELFKNLLPTNVIKIWILNKTKVKGNIFSSPLDTCLLQDNQGQWLHHRHNKEALPHRPQEQARRRTMERRPQATRELSPQVHPTTAVNKGHLNNVSHF
jgi:hypothetical protein